MTTPITTLQKIQLAVTAFTLGFICAWALHSTPASSASTDNMDGLRTMASINDGACPLFDQQQGVMWWGPCELSGTWDRQDLCFNDPPRTRYGKLGEAMKCSQDDSVTSAVTITERPL